MVLLYNMCMSKTVTLSLSNAECLVLLDFLSERIDTPREGQKKFDFSNPDFAEKVAFSNLLGALEPKVDVVFSERYAEHLKVAKKELTEGHTPEAFGE